MSALLQFAPKDPSSGGLLLADGIDAPDYWLNGLPFSDGKLAIDSAGAISHYHQGLPFTAAGRVAVNSGDPTYFGSGVAPFDSSKLSAASAVVSGYANGVAYGVSGRLILGGAFFYLNGTNQYITLDNGWTPPGFPFSVSVRTRIDGAIPNTRAVLSSTDNADLVVYTLGTTPATNYKNLPNTGTSISLASPALSSLNTWKIDYTAQGSVGSISGVAMTAGAAGIPKSATLSPIKTIGAFTGGGSFWWTGPISDVVLTYGGAIQGREFQVGNGTALGTLNTPIEIDCSQPWVIEFDWENGQDGLGTAMYLLAHATGDPDFELLVLTNGTIRMDIGAVNASVQWNSALANVALGQRSHYKIEHVSGTNTILTIDGRTIAKTSGDISSKTGTISKLLATGGGGAKADGAIANLEITAKAPRTAAIHGLLDYGSDHPSVIEFFPATQNVVGATGIGSLQLISAGTIAFDAEKGMSLAGVCAAFWNPAFTTTAHGLKTKGFTLQFEVEKGLFATGYTPSDAIQGVASVGDSVLNVSVARNQSTSNFVNRTQAGAQASGFKTANDSYSDFVQVHFVIDVAGQLMSMYIDKFLVGQFATADLSAATDFNIAITGFGGLFGFSFNHPFFIRNVQICEYPNTRVNAKSFANISASQGLYGGYQCVPTVADANNVPPARVSGLAQAENITNLGYYQLSTFGHIEAGMENRGLSVNPKIANYGSGGASIVYWNSTGLFGPEPLDNHMENLVDNAFADLPAGKADYFLVDLAGGDVLFLKKLPSMPADYREQIETTMRAQLDRLIDSGGAERIIILGCQRLFFTFSAPFFFETEQFAELVQEVNAILATFEDYRGLCTFVDVYTNSKKEYYIDDLHWNTLGCDYVGKLIAAALPNAAFDSDVTYAYPLIKRIDNTPFIENTNLVTGDAFNGVWTGQNWVAYPSLSRRYAINDKSTTLIDGYHSDDAAYNATIINPAASGGGWNYEP